MSDPSVEGVRSFSPNHARERHVVHLYSDDHFLIDVLSRFVAGALAAGGSAVVIATESHSAALGKQLSRDGLDAATATQQGRYVVLDATEILSKIVVNGAVDENRFHDVIGGILTQARSGLKDEGRRIAVFGELVALLWAEGKADEAIRVEQLWNDLAKNRAFSLLCAYPVKGFEDDRNTEAFLRMCRQHSDVVAGELATGAASDEDRLRSIARLQQRTHALEKELALYRSEERFRLLVEAVQDYAIFMLDPRGIVSSWNIGAERMKGYRADEIVGTHFSRFYPEEDVQSGKPEWELVTATKEGRFEDEGWRLRKDGTPFWANVIITALRDDSGKLIGFAKVTRDITERMQTQRALEKEVAERREAQRQLHDSEQSLRDLSLRLLHTQDAERRRIARELHDSVGQLLAAMSMNLSVLQGEELSPAAAKAVADNASLQAQAITEIRTMSHLLHPPLLEEAGLPSALSWYVEGFSERSKIAVNLHIAENFDRLPDELEITVFRIVQECLTNIHRHSGSRTAAVCLAQEPNRLKLEVRDEGKGLPLEKKLALTSSGQIGVGLRGMRERISQLDGILEISSSEEGTVVKALIPLKRDRAVNQTDAVT